MTFHCLRSNRCGQYRFALIAVGATLFHTPSHWVVARSTADIIMSKRDLHRTTAMDAVKGTFDATVLSRAAQLPSEAAAVSRYRQALEICQLRRRHLTGRRSR